MSDALEGAVALSISADEATFASLPPPLARLVFLALPPDARGRACCVCRAWRDALADPSLWTRLDLSFVRTERVGSVLRNAAGRSLGLLRELDLSQQDVEWRLLLPVLTANAGSLRELHLLKVSARDVGDGRLAVEAVVAAAPLLQVLTSEEQFSNWETAPRMLRAEGAFAVLRMRRSLFVRFKHEDGLERFGPFAAALADAAQHPALLHVVVRLAGLAQPAVMNALADAAVVRRLRELSFQYCTPPAAAPLARLLAEGSLASLDIDNQRAGTPLLDAAGATLVADALRVNTTITTLKLSSARLCDDMRVAGALLGALLRHPSLRELRIISDFSPILSSGDIEDRNAFGAALGELIAADAPPLHVLDCYLNCLGDAGLAPIVDALAFNRHLRELDVGCTGISETFARDQLLPVVRANTTLRKFKCESVESGPAAVEAEELVRRRGQHDG